MTETIILLSLYIIILLSIILYCFDRIIYCQQSLVTGVYDLYDGRETEKSAKDVLLIFALCDKNAENTLGIFPGDNARDYRSGYNVIY